MFMTKLLGSLLIVGGISCGITIAILNNNISKLKEEIRVLEKTIYSYEVDLKTERENVTLLELTVIDLNKQVERYKVKNQEVLKKYNQFMSKKLEDRVSGKVKEVVEYNDGSGNSCNIANGKLKKLEELTLEDF